MVVEVAMSKFIGGEEKNQGGSRVRCTVEKLKIEVSILSHVFVIKSCPQVNLANDPSIP